MLNLEPLAHLIARLQQTRWSQLAVVNLRILLGFAFVPAGLKKVLGQPFTDPANTGAFHEFLHAFHATGFFYRFVGLVQLLIAILLMTQTRARLGSLLALPVITSIMVFCWSTWVVPTATVTTLMFAATCGLVFWDWSPLAGAVTTSKTTGPPTIDPNLWRNCGATILVFYGLACFADGGIYRPRGLDLQEPAFYVLMVIPLFPAITLLWERSRMRSPKAPQQDLSVD